MIAQRVKALEVLAALPFAQETYKDPDVFAQVEACRGLGASWREVGRAAGGIGKDAARMRYLAAAAFFGEEPVRANEQAHGQPCLIDDLLRTGVTRAEMRQFLEDTKHITVGKPWHLLLEKAS